jgi:hypothetical protein
LQSGGELVIGQQRNSGGEFDTNRGWQATLQDLRIFSDVRTASEIAASYRSDLPFNEQGMIANWRFNDLSSAGVTTDSVAGNNLTLANTGQANHVAGTANLVFASTKTHSTAPWSVKFPASTPNAKPGSRVVGGRSEPAIQRRDGQVLQTGANRRHLGFSQHGGIGYQPGRRFRPIGDDPFCGRTRAVHQFLRDDERPDLARRS